MLRTEAQWKSLVSNHFSESVALIESVRDDQMWFKAIHQLSMISSKTMRRKCGMPIAHSGKRHNVSGFSASVALALLSFRLKLPALSAESAAGSS